MTRTLLICLVVFLLFAGFNNLNAGLTVITNTNDNGQGAAEGTESSTYDTNYFIGDENDSGLRSFLQFNLVSIPSNATITSATLIVYQKFVSNTPYADLGPNMEFDYGDYGDILDATDYNTGFSNWYSNLGIISSDSTIGYKTNTGTNLVIAVQAAVSNARSWTKGSSDRWACFRFRFPVETDSNGTNCFAEFRHPNETGFESEFPVLKIDWFIFTNKPVHNVNLGKSYTSISNAITELSNGHELLVDPGIYTDYINLSNKTNVIIKSTALASNWTTNTILYGDGVSPVISLSNTLGCSVSGFDIRNGYYGIFSSANSLNSNIFTNNNIYSNVTGIGVTNGDYNLIYKNNIYNNSNGIYITGSSRSNKIYENWITNNFLSGILLEDCSNNIVGISNSYNRIADNDSGIKIGGTASFNEVKYNFIYFNNTGIAMVATNGNNIIEHNTIFMSVNEGIYILAAGNKYLNNIIVSNGNYGINASGVTVTNEFAWNTVWHHNTQNYNDDTINTFDMSKIYSNNVNLNPKFASTDPASGDFLKLTSYSPCIKTASDRDNRGARLGGGAEAFVNTGISYNRHKAISIDANETWTQVSSPIVILSSLLIKSNVTITIEPGTEIVMLHDNGEYSNNQHSSGDGMGGTSIHFLLNGNIAAIGSPTNEIIFKSDNPSPGDFSDWGSVVYIHSNYGAVTGQSYFKHCKFLNGGVAANYYEQVNVPAFEKCSFFDSRERYIARTAKNANNNIIFRNCLIVDVAAGGYVPNDGGGKIESYNCTVYDWHMTAGSLGAWTSDGGDITVENNILYGGADSDFGLSRVSGSLTSRYNLIYDCKSSDYNNVVDITNDITGQNPMFVDISATNFHLCYSSPALTNGATNGIGLRASIGRYSGWVKTDSDLTETLTRHQLTFITTYSNPYKHGAIPDDGSFEIDYPAGFDLSNVTTATLISTVVSEVLSIGVSGTKLILNRPGGGPVIPAGEIIALRYSQVSNIAVMDTNYFVTFTTKSNSGTIIDGPEDSNMFGIFEPHIFTFTKLTNLGGVFSGFSNQAVMAFNIKDNYHSISSFRIGNLGTLIDGNGPAGIAGMKLWQDVDTNFSYRWSPDDQYVCNLYWNGSFWTNGNISYSTQLRYGRDFIVTIDLSLEVERSNTFMGYVPTNGVICAGNLSLPTNDNITNSQILMTPILLRYSSLVTHASYSFTNYLGALAAGDLNNDSLIDIVVRRSDSAFVTLINNGDMTFSESSAYGANRVQSLALGDIDNDGDLDCITLGGNYYLDKFENNGSGSFGGAVNIGTERYRGGIAIRDLNGDGYVDIIAAGSDGSDYLHKLINDGTGNFTETSIGIPIANGSVAIMDLEGDNDFDFVAAGNNGGTEQLYSVTNNGNAGFGTPVSFGQALDYPSIAAGDIDNDGDIDVITTGSDPSGTTRYFISYTNTGGILSFYANISPGISAGNVSLGDMDNDGDLDLVASGNNGTNEILKLYMNDGNGNYSFDHDIAQDPAENAGHLLIDLDDDGTLDLVKSDFRDGLYRLEFIKNICKISNEPPSIPAGLVETNYNGFWAFKWSPAGDDYTGASMMRYNVAVGTNSGVYKFSGTNIDFPRGQANMGNVAAAASEFFVSSVSNSKTVYWKVCAIDSSFKSSGYSVEQTAVGVIPSQFFSNQEPAVRLRNGSLEFGDYDNDGDLDILATGSDGSAPRFIVYENNSGNYVVGEQPMGVSGVSNSSAAFGDYDNDGDLDIAISGRNGLVYRFIIYRNDNGTFNLDHEPMGGNIGVMESSIAFGDIDNDGDLDIALTGYDGSDERFIIFENRDGIYTNIQEPMGTNLGLRKSSVAFLDFDNDGDMDLAVTGAAGINKRFIIYRNDDGVFSLDSEPMTPDGVEGPGSIACGDYDGDGDLDIAVVGNDGSASRFIVFRNDSGSYSLDHEPMGIDTGLINASAAFGDYDNDGDFDLAVSGSDGLNNRFMLWRNNNDSYDRLMEPMGKDTGVRDSSVAFGDYDNDGDLDIALSGYDGSLNRFLIFSNEESTLNNAPAEPSGMSSTNYNGRWYFSWTAPADVNTPAELLRYHIALSTNNTSYDYVSTNITYPRGQANMGKVTIVTGTPYYQSDITMLNTVYWKVLAIDSAFKASPYCTQQTSYGVPHEFSITNTTNFSTPFIGYYNQTIMALNISDNIEDTLASFKIGNLGTLSNGNGPKGITNVKLWQDIDGDKVWSGNDIYVTNLYYDGSLWVNDNITYATQLMGGKDFVVTVDLSLQVAESNTFQAYIPVNGIECSLGGQHPTNAFTNNGVRTIGQFLIVAEPLGVNVGIHRSSVAYGDYDNDGDLDLAIAGATGSGRICILYKNDNGIFSQDQEPMAGDGNGVHRSSIAFGDIDNDGDLDLAVTGEDSGNNERCIIYENDSGTFNYFDEPMSGDGGGIYRSSIAFGDLNNDGDLDLVITGNDKNTRRFVIYENNSAGIFSPGQELGDIEYTSVAIGDIDNDGDLDIAATGSDGNDERFYTYTNNGSGGFGRFQYPMGAANVGAIDSSIAFGDIDNDGDLDLALAGYDDNTHKFSIWTNNSGTLGLYDDLMTGSEEGVRYSSIAFGDIDNDGDLDIVMTGQDDDGDQERFIIWRNDSGVFTNINEPMGINQGVYNSSIALGDHDNDGDLDMVVTGDDSANRRFIIYQNTISSANTSPVVPAGMSAVAGTNGFWRLSWNQSSDDHTPADMLRYHVAFGTNSGDYEFLSDAVDYPRGQANLGNIVVVTGALYYQTQITNTIYWKVCAIDSAFKSSGFCIEQTNFQIPISKIIEGQHPFGTNRGFVDAASEFGDIDNDGDLDFVIAGSTGTTNRFLIYRNDDGTLNLIQEPLTAGKGLNDPAVAFGDINSDGYLDLAVAGVDYTNNRRFIIYTNSGGAFSTNQQPLGINLGLASPSLAFGDYDNDSDLDLFVTGFDGSYRKFMLYKNNSGTFTIDQYPMGTNSGIENGSISVGDFDNDSDMDVAVAGFDGNNRRFIIYWNDDGVFTNSLDPESASDGFEDASLVCGDYDEDGDLDLAVSGYDGTDPRFIIYINDAGAFSSASVDEPYGGIGFTNSSIAFGDYNNDGDLDLIATGYDSSNRRFVIFDNDAGTLSPEQEPMGTNIGFDHSSLVLGDVDNDGDLEMCISGIDSSNKRRLVIFSNDVSANNSPPNVPTGMSTTGVNGKWCFSWDQASDPPTSSSIIRYHVAFGTNSEVYNFSSRSIGFPRGQANPGNIAIVTGRPFYQTQITNLTPVFWKVCAIDPSFKQSAYCIKKIGMPPSDTTIGPTPMGPSDGLRFPSIACGDIDNDGDLDIIATGEDENNAERFIIFTNNTGTFGIYDEPGIGVKNSSVACGDIDNDGDLDIALTGEDSSGERQFIIYKNNAGTFGSPAYPMGGLDFGVRLSAIAFGDINNDGSLDLVVTGEDDGNDERFVIYTNDGSGTFNSYANPFGAANRGVKRSSVVLGDIDNDGDLDAVITGRDHTGGGGDDRFVIWRNDSGTFNIAQQPFGSSSGVDRGSLAFGDIDSDGYLDLALSGDDNSGDPRLIIYTNNAGTFGLKDELMGSDQGLRRSSVAFGDYDNDGDLDLVAMGYDGANNQFIIYNNDNGNFEEGDLPMESDNGLLNCSIALGDFDNDNYLDIATTGDDGATNRFYIFINGGTTFPNSSPSVPTGMTASSNSQGDWVLYWNQVIGDATPANLMRYQVAIGTNPGVYDYCSTNIDFPRGQANPGKVTLVSSATVSYTTKISNSRTIFWKVCAIDSGFKTSGYCTERVAVFKGPPYDPTGFHLAALSSNSIELGWIDNSHNESNYIATIIYSDRELINIISNIYSTNRYTNVISLAPDSSNCVFSNLDPNRFYYMSVVATNEYGYSIILSTNLATAAVMPKLNPPYDTSIIQKTNAFDFIEFETVYSNGGAAYYYYTLTTNTVTFVSNTETFWDIRSVNATATAPTNGTWYLYVTSYNIQDIGKYTYSFGPLKVSDKLPLSISNIRLDKQSASPDGVDVINLSAYGILVSGNIYIEDGQRFFVTVEKGLCEITGLSGTNAVVVNSSTEITNILTTNASINFQARSFIPGNATIRVSSHDNPDDCTKNVIVSFFNNPSDLKVSLNDNIINPYTGDRARLRVINEKEQQIRVTLYNMQRHMIKDFGWQSQPPGLIDVLGFTGWDCQINGSFLKPGRYFFVVECANWNEPHYRRLFIVK